MLLQSNHCLNVSSYLSYSPPLSFKTPSLTLPKPLYPQKLSIRCSISQIHSYGTLDYEQRPLVKWNDIYKRISLMENPESGSSAVLNQWENEGKSVTKWELCRVIKELRKYKRHDRALEVYDWMSNRAERFRLSTSDAAIQLDLIAKVRGVSSAEEYYMRLSDKLKDKRIYGALLNAYVSAKMKEKAESLLDQMRSKGYAMHSLPFNVMMTLYMNLKEYDKVDSMVSEMMEKNIQFDIYSYNIWLSSCGSAEKMEQVYEKMKMDKTIIPNWTTFSTMATIYIKMDQFEKAEECLRKVESRIKGRDRIPYHYLLSLYGSIGKKEDLYRIWKTYKSIFPSVPNLGYHAIISSLVRMGDIEGAEELYEEWLSVKLSYDARIGNLLMGWYVKNSNMVKSQNLFEHMIEVGGKPNSTTWETLAEGHTKEKRVSEALTCFKEAFIADGSKSWKPKPVNVTAFFKLCQEEHDRPSKEALVGLLRDSGHLKDATYSSLIDLAVHAGSDNEPSRMIDASDVISTE